MRGCFGQESPSTHGVDLLDFRSTRGVIYRQTPDSIIRTTSVAVTGWLSQ